MSKSLLHGGIALVLLWGTMAGAEEPPAEPDLQFGPVRVRVMAQPLKGVRVQASPVQVQVQVQATTEETPGESVQVHAGPVQVHVGVKPIKLSDYWVGLECHPARGVLNTQLGLPEDQGLVVENVRPDSPAAKAGIKRHDVLVTAGGKPLKELPDLIGAIEQAKEKELSFELIRDGKKTKIAVTPQKRPEGAGPHVYVPRPGQGEWHRVWDWVEKMRPGAGGRGPIGFRIFGPGAILPPDAPLRPPLPKNMQVTITKQGDEPARIVVKMDDQKWEVTEEELDKLPEKVRPHVERMLGRLPGFDFKVFEPGPEWPHPPQIKPEDFTPQIELPPTRLEKRLEKRIEEMNRRMEDLRKSIDQMREKRQRRTAPKNNEPDKA